MMTHSENLNELAAALAKAQAAMKAAPRDAQNPHFRSRFASLSSVWEACRGPLTENGLSVLQMPGAAAEVVVGGEVVADGRAVSMTTMLLHASGQWIKESLTMTARDATPQSVGSAITYARRYGLQAAVGICTEDDDGEAATERPAPVPSQAREHVVPVPAPAPRPQPAHTNGHGHDHGPERPRQFDAPPRTGKALFARLKDLEQEHTGLIKWLNSYGKLQDWPGRMVDWDAAMVETAFGEVTRKLEGRGEGDAPEEVHHREPGEEG